MQHFSFEIKLTEDYRNYWHVYTLCNSNGNCLYYGVSDLYGIINLSDVKKHYMYSVFFPKDSIITINIWESFNEKKDGYQWLYKNGWLSRRPGIMKYYSALRGQVAVKCLDTGEVFNTMTECAKAHGINISNLSKHLRGNPNYRMVSGKRYEQAKFIKDERGIPRPY